MFDEIKCDRFRRCRAFVSAHQRVKDIAKTICKERHSKHLI